VIPDHVIEEVRARADIVEILGEQLPLKRAGKDFRALCPFHNEKTPSFYVVPAKGFYKCFGCGEAGDVFKFLMERHGLSFSEAVREIARRVGVEIPEAEESHDEPHRALYEALAFADDYFRAALRDDAAAAGARRYVQERGITAAAVQRFGLGYALPGWGHLRDAARKHGIDDEVLLEAGLVKIGERSAEPYDRFRDRLMFPTLDMAGRTIAFGGRVLGGSGAGAPKYLNSPETPVHHKGRILYGLNWSKGAIRREGLALLVEGYMDYVSLAARDVEHVVAGLGTALTDEQANLLARFTGRAVLLYDSDMAGLRATFRTGDALLRAGIHPLAVDLPAGEDPDSITRSGGAAALERHIDDAVDVLERKLQILEQRGFFTDIEGSRRALDRLLPTLRAVVDPALRDIYVARVAERTGVRRQTLEAEIAAPTRRAEADDGGSAGGAGGYVTPAAQHRRRPFAGDRRGGGWPEPPRTQRRRESASERLLLLILLRDPRRIVDAATVIGADEFRDPVHREIYGMLLASPDGSTADAVLSGPARQRLDELLADRTEVADGDQSFEDAVAELKGAELFLKLATLDGREQAVALDDFSVLRERETVLRQLRELYAELGYKGSPRLRRLLRTGRDANEPGTQEDH
jgi:DNA primase